MNEQTEGRLLRELVGRIDEVTKVRVQAEAIAKSLKEREQVLRHELLEHMQLCDTRTVLVGDVSATIRNIRHVDVINEDALRSATERDGVGEDYMVFNLAKAKTDAIKNEWPGIEVRVQQQLVVSRKEKLR